MVFPLNEYASKFGYTDRKVCRCENNKAGIKINTYQESEAENTGNYYPKVGELCYWQLSSIGNQNRLNRCTYLGKENGCFKIEQNGRVRLMRMPMKFYKVKERNYE